MLFIVGHYYFSILKYYCGNQSIIYYWEQQGQLIQLIDQLTISNLEATIVIGSGDSSSSSLGFPQHLQLSEPLNREVIEQEYYSRRERILNGDPNNLQKLTKLFNQAEKLLKDNKEV